MKTIYKILTVIAITLSIQGGLYLGITSCPSISECQILFDLYEYVGFSIIFQMCASVVIQDGEIIKDIDCDPEIYEIRLNHEGYFLFFFVVIPISIIVTIWYRDRK